MQNWLWKLDYTRLLCGLLESLALLINCSFLTHTYTHASTYTPRGLMLAENVIYSFTFIFQANLPLPFSLRPLEALL